jgi:hypothetical protein
VTNGAELVEVDADHAIEELYALGWTDGLPVVPPTPQRVEAMLAAGDVAGDAVLGRVVERHAVVRAVDVAVNAVLAGCEPASFPVVLAAARATLDPTFNAAMAVTSTGGAALCVVVRGPLVAELGFNTGHSALGSGHRANATVGRALRLMAGNVLGARPGTTDSASLSHPGKFTFCIAEGTPPAGWEEAKESTVTVLAAEGPRQIGNGINPDPEGIVRTIAAAARTPSNFIVGKGGQGIVVLGPEHAAAMAAAGWSRADVQRRLVELTRVHVDELGAAGVLLEDSTNQPEPDDDGYLPTFADPDDIVLVTTGGHGAGWSAFAPSIAPRRQSRWVSRTVVPPRTVPTPGPARGRSTLVVHRPAPTPAPVAAGRLATRVELGAGARILLLDNGKPNAPLLLTELGAALAARWHAGAPTFVGKAAAGRPLDDAEVDALAPDHDVALTALGDCGACTLGSFRDAMALESRGVPVLLVVTEPFLPLVASLACEAGLGDYPVLALPHPVASKGPDELRRLVSERIDTAAALVTGSVAVSA